MKIVVRIFNVLYLILAAVAITCFCTQPYISIDGSYVVKGQQISQFLPKEVEDYLTKEEIEQIVEEQQARVNIKLEVPASLVFSFNDREKIESTINDMLNTTVEGTVADLNPVIHELAEAIAKKTANNIIYKYISDYVDMYKNPEFTETGAALDAAGIDETYIADFTNEVYDKLSQEGATLDNVYDVVQDKVEDVVSKLSEQGILEPGVDPSKLTEDLEDDIKKSIQESFEAFGIVDENGNITDIDAAVDNLLLSLLDDLIKEGDPTPTPGHEHIDENKDHFCDDIECGIRLSECTTPEHSHICEYCGERATYCIDKDNDGICDICLQPMEGAITKSISLGENSKEETEKSAEEQLTEKIRILLKQYVDQYNIPGYVADYGLYIFIATLFLMLPWALLGIFSFIRILRPKKCWIKTWYLFVFASIQLILGIILTVATTSFLPQIINVLPGGSDFKDVIDTLTLAIKTSCFIPSIFYLLMIPMVIVYSIFRHKVKKQYKADKLAKKNEKKTA